MTILAVILIGVAGVLVFGALRRGRRGQDQRQGRAGQPGQAASQNEAAGKPSFFRRWFGGGRQSDPQQQFAAWVELVALEPPELRPWLKGLSAAEYGTLVNALIQFCQGLGFDLTWLYLPSSTTNKELQRCLQRIVQNYLAARCTSAQAQDAVLAFRTYSAYLRKPYETQQQVFAQKLFDHLLAQGLTPPTTAELLMAKTKVRQRYMVEAIALADEQYPDAFVAVLKETVRADTPAAAAPAEATRQQPAGTGAPTGPVGSPAAP